MYSLGFSACDQQLEYFQNPLIFLSLCVTVSWPLTITQPHLTHPGLLNIYAVVRAFLWINLNVDLQPYPAFLMLTDDYIDVDFYIVTLRIYQTLFFFIAVGAGIASLQETTQCSRLSYIRLRSFRLMVFSHWRFWNRKGQVVYVAGCMADCFRVKGQQRIIYHVAFRKYRTEDQSSTKTSFASWQRSTAWDRSQWCTWEPPTSLASASGLGSPLR